MMGKCSKGERGHPNRTRNMRSDLWEAHPCASRIHQPCFSHPEQPTHKCFTQPWGPSHGASPNHGVLHTGSTFLGVPHSVHGCASDDLTESFKNIKCKCVPEGNILYHNPSLTGLTNCVERHTQSNMDDKSLRNIVIQN